MPDFDVPATAPLEVQLAAFTRATDPGGVDWANTETLYADPIWSEVKAQNIAIGVLAKRLAALVDDTRVADALTRVVREQNANTIGFMVAMAVVEVGAPRAALELIAPWLDKHDDDVHRVTVAVQATLQLRSPADAFEVIAPLLDGDLAEAAYDGLVPYRGNVDPRFFEIAAKALTEGNSGRFLAVHSGQPEAVAVIATELERIAAGGNVTGHFYWMLADAVSLDGIGPVVSETSPLVPQILAVVESAIPHGDWRLTQPLAILAKVADAAIAQRLRELVPTAKGKAKAALAATVAELDKKFPPPAGAKAAKPTKAVKVASPMAQTLVDAGLLAERANAIAKLARGRIEMTPAKQSKHVVGATRFGGVPDLPARTKWPTVTITAKQLLLGVDEYPAGTFPEPDAKGRYEVPLAFVAQLDLATLAPLDAATLLPTTGMLSFFARQEPDLGQKRDLRVIGSAVLYTGPKAKLDKREPPSELPKRLRYKAATTKPKATTPLPPATIESIGKLGLADAEKQTYGRAIAEQETPDHASLGWADAGYYRGIPAANEQLLLRVGSDEVSGFEWGDAAPIFFVIPTAALANKAFDKAYCVMDE